MSYLFIAATILLTVYGQMVIKWQVTLQPGLAVNGLNAKVLLSLLCNPWIISAFAAAFGASLFWMAALSELPLSKAYPFTALSFPLIALLAAWFFHEQIDINKITGTAFIILGVLILSRSAA